MDLTWRPSVGRVTTLRQISHDLRRKLHRLARGYNLIVVRRGTRMYQQKMDAIGKELYVRERAIGERGTPREPLVILGLCPTADL